MKCRLHFYHAFLIPTQVLFSEQRCWRAHALSSPKVQASCQHQVLLVWEPSAPPRTWRQRTGLTAVTGDGTWAGLGTALGDTGTWQWLVMVLREAPAMDRAGRAILSWSLRCRNCCACVHVCIYISSPVCIPLLKCKFPLFPLEIFLYFQCNLKLDAALTFLFLSWLFMQLVFNLCYNSSVPLHLLSSDNVFYGLGKQVLKLMPTELFFEKQKVSILFCCFLNAIHNLTDRCLIPPQSFFLQTSLSSFWQSLHPTSHSITVLPSHYCPLIVCEF